MIDQREGHLTLLTLEVYMGFCMADLSRGFPYQNDHSGGAVTS